MVLQFGTLKITKLTNFAAIFVHDTRNIHVLLVYPSCVVYMYEFLSVGIVSLQRKRLETIRFGKRYLVAWTRFHRAWSSEIRNEIVKLSLSPLQPPVTGRSVFVGGIEGHRGGDESEHGAVLPVAADNPRRCDYSRHDTEIDGLQPPLNTSTFMREFPKVNRRRMFSYDAGPSRAEANLNAESAGAHPPRHRNLSPVIINNARKRLCLRCRGLLRASLEASIKPSRRRATDSRGLRSAYARDTELISRVISARFYCTLPLYKMGSKRKEVSLCSLERVKRSGYFLRVIKNIV